MQKYRQIYRNLSIQDRIGFISRLSPSAFEEFRYFSNLTLRDNQIVPDDWKGRYYVALCGRGWGKTKMGAYWVKTKVYNNQKGLAIVAPTYKDLEEVMVPAIIAEFPERHKPRYLGGNKGKLICHNGVEILCYTSETELRGGNYSAVWCDELAKWCSMIPSKVKERFQVLDFANRKGDAQFLITTTPKEWEIFYEWEDRFRAGDKLIYLINGTIDENEDLSPIAKQALHSAYDNTRMGSQELNGTLLRDNPNALWSSNVIERCHITKQNFDKLLIDGTIIAVRTVVAVDPAVTTNIYSDETGIIVSTLCSDNKVYVHQDASGKLTPDQWASKAVELYRTFDASHIIMESNQGGNLLEQAIKTVDRYVRTKLIHASVGKQTKFEPVVMAYERNEIFHVGNLATLERQMLSYNPYIAHQSSPDRIDALSYTIYDLLLSQLGAQYRSCKPFGAW